MTVAAAAEPVQRAQTSLGVALKGPSHTLAPADVAARLQLTFDALRRASAGLPRDTFDIAAVTTRTGRDVDRLFAWVRDETRLVPYIGTLRGARGVLMDRVGNSLDRALLLVDLLESTGQEVRLANTTLTQSQVDALLLRLKAEPPWQPAAVGDGAAAVVDTLLEEYAKRFQTPAETLRERLDTLRRSGEAAGREAARRAHLQAASLLEIPGLTRPKVGSEDSLHRAALADHWWVEVDTGGRWTSLDPSGVIAASGALPANAVTVLRPADLPEELHHQLRIQVVIECVCGGQLIERSVLEHTLNLREHPFDPIVIQQAPTAPLSTERVDSWPAVRSWLLTQDEWMPALSVGGKMVTQSAFTLSGEVRQPGSGSAGPAGGLLDAFGGGNETATATGRLTAEVLVFDLKIPGQPTRHERRVLVDWIGSRTRRDLGGKAPAESSVQPVRTDLLNSTEILPLAAQPSTAYVAERTANALLLGSQDLLILAQLTPNTAMKPTLDQASTPFPNALFELALARKQLNPEGALTYLREANVLTRHQGFADTKDGADIWSAFDIVYNRVGVKPGIDAGAAFDVRLRQGVLDTNTEVLLDATRTQATNVSEFMATQPGEVWILQREPGDQTSAERTWIGRASDTSRASSVGYWYFDPHDGTVLGMTSAGWGGVDVGRGGGQAMTSYAVKHEKVIRTIGVIFRYLMAIACAASTVRQMLEADSQSSPLFVMGRGAVKMTGCGLGGIFGGLGIAYGGAVGNLYSRMGDVFSIAFTISNWI